MDKTTKKNIMWATDAYSEYGSEYLRNEEIKPHLITGSNSDIIKTRARKDMEQQFERTRQRAEVFTPLWICERMNNDAERFWFEQHIEMGEANNLDYLTHILNDAKLFKKYIDSKRLEITCGEAPYIVSRYDMATGEVIPVENRIGILDRKLQAINKYAKNEKDWMYWAVRAYQATFGYEFQGDNVLIARVNLLMTLDEYMDNRWGRKSTIKEKEKLANIIAWNIWQMDGLTYTIPYSEAEEHFKQLDWFGLLQDEDDQETNTEENTKPYCRIYDWHNKKKSVEFKELKEGMHMKFDFIIGNPPYQEEQEGDNKTFAPPVYHKFMEECYGISDKVELIHPARFLFNAGSTPKDWNRKMLSDPHYKVQFYEQDSSKVFPNTDIKGGVAISYRDAEKEYGAIGTFTPFIELNSIMKKVCDRDDFDGLNNIVLSRTIYRLTENVHKDFPEAVKRLSKGHPYDMSSNILELLPEVFLDKKINEEYIEILGRIKNERAVRYVKREYINNPPDLEYYKVFVPAANGSGALGEVLSTPLIGRPLIGRTELFISIGTFQSEQEAEACLKYIKSKFCRAMLGILKITQHNPPEKWRYVPYQDFTTTSDIDWSQSISGVDRQLYKKYGLSQEEIDFIETHVKEME